MEKFEYLKCFDVKDGKIFFISYCLPFDKYLKLVDSLIDSGFKIKKCSYEDLSKQNPFIQNSYHVFYFDSMNVDMNIGDFIESSLHTKNI